MKPQTPELERVIAAAERLRATPEDQESLAFDRINDLRIAIDEWERAYVQDVNERRMALLFGQSA